MGSGEYLYLSITMGALCVILAPVIVDTYPLLYMIEFKLVVNMLNVDGLPTFMVLCPSIVNGSVSIHFVLSNNNN